LEAKVAFLDQFALKVAQLSQRKSTAGWVSYGQNISGSPLAVPVINALILSGLCEYRCTYMAKNYILWAMFLSRTICVYRQPLRRNQPPELPNSIK